MRKVLSFSAFLVVGLFIAQYLPAWSGSDYGTVKTVSNVLLYICLGFIMINVGREFEVDKSRWQTYAKDYFVAMATAAMPWFLIAIYYIFVLLPPEYWNSWEAWKENLLLSRFAAPTSAGILFTMLAAIGLKSSWIYKKIQVLAIFDDLDTILLMIPLQIMMIGPRWQFLVIVFIVFLLLSFGWKQLGAELGTASLGFNLSNTLCFVCSSFSYVLVKVNPFPPIDETSTCCRSIPGRWSA